MTTDSVQLSGAAVARLMDIVSHVEDSPPPVHPDYLIEAPIARGGMGTVYRATQNKLRRTVALKVMNEVRPDLRQRFEREAVSTANLQHPNIVPVFDYGELQDGRLFYTMKLVEGRNLHQLIRQLHAPDQTGPTLPMMLRFLCQVCDAMSYAHDQGVIHRDLKPSNIMVADFNQVWVLDWGLVRVADREEPAHHEKTSSVLESAPNPMDSSPTRAGQVLGTPAYMAPEQVRAHADRLGPATDVYAAGAVLYEILAGKPPFSGVPDNQTPDRIRGPEALSWSPGTIVVPRPLRSVVRRAMMTEPADRYESAQALANDLRAWMDGQAVSAHSETWTERTRRVVRRHRLAFAVVAFYLLARAAVLILSGR